MLQRGHLSDKLQLTKDYGVKVRLKMPLQNISMTDILSTQLLFDLSFLTDCKHSNRMSSPQQLLLLMQVIYVNCQQHSDSVSSISSVKTSPANAIKISAVILNLASDKPDIDSDKPEKINISVRSSWLLPTNIA